MKRDILHNCRSGSVMMRFFFCFAMFAILPIVAITYLFYQDARSEFISVKVEDIKEISSLRLRSVSGDVDNLKRAAQRIAESNTVRNVFIGEMPEDINVLSERFLRRGFASFAIFNEKSGLLVADSVQTRQFFKGDWDKSISGKAYASAIATGNFSCSDVSLDTPSGKSGIVFAIPVKDGSRVMGAVLLYVNLERLQEIMLDDTRGVLSTEIFICSYREKVPFIIAGANSEGGVEPAYMGVIAKTIQGANISANSKRSGISLSKDYLGKTVVASWDYIPELDWYIIMKTDLSELFSGLYSLRDRMLIVLGIFVPIALLLSFMIAKFLSAPFDSILKRLSAIIPEGYADKSASGGAEFRTLSGSINYMRDAVVSAASKASAFSSEISVLSERITTNLSKRADIRRKIESDTEKVLLHSRKIGDSCLTLAHNIESVEGVAENSVRQAESGLDGIIRINALMSEIEVNSKEALAMLEETFNAGRKIGDVVDTMTKLSEKANLLSLNATIEYKKTNIEGSGFGVIAEQLRTLAERIAVSTSEIENISSGIVSLSESGSRKVRDFDAKFTDAASQMKLVSENLGEIIQRLQGIPTRLELLLDGVKGQSAESATVNAVSRSLKKAVVDETKLSDSAGDSAQMLSKISKSMRRDIAKMNL